MKKRKPIENVQFILGGILIILGGVQNTYPIIGGLLLFLGVSLLIYAFYIIITRRRNPVLKIFALCSEFIALIAAAFILYRNGSNYLHVLYLIAALGIAVAICVHAFKMYNTKKI